MSGERINLCKRVQILLQKDHHLKSRVIQTNVAVTRCQCHFIILRRLYSFINVFMNDRCNTLNARVDKSRQNLSVKCQKGPCRSGKLKLSHESSNRFII